MSDLGVDRIYLAACARDARLTRICLASIRYFYPDAPIQILAGDILQRGLARELRKHWNVEVADLPAGDYGWGLVKLEPLFGPPGQRFLVADVDTVFTGRVLDLRAASDAPFFVDDERLSDADFKRLYYDWDKLAAIDPQVQTARAAFNVGQWFGTAGLVPREAFDPWVEWTLPRRLRYPDLFMGGDQGVMNYVVLQREAFDGLRIERRTFMRWPGAGMDGLDAASVAAGTAPPLIVHWAGMKATFLRDMVGGDLLQFFEDHYYRQMPLGAVRKRLALWRHVWIQWSFAIRRRLKLRLRAWFKAIQS
ncbi:MAG: hypothetical protein WDM85_08100 [Caulobacteraceae bacterium]